jgi:FtsH-binding integral membrane protein
MWMNHTDGLIFTTIGVLLFFTIINYKSYSNYILELTVGVIGTVLITAYIIYEYIAKEKKKPASKNFPLF